MIRTRGPDRAAKSVTRAPNRTETPTRRGHLEPLTTDPTPHRTEAAPRVPEHRAREPPPTTEPLYAGCTTRDTEETEP